jgi:hypothetical protein
MKFVDEHNLGIIRAILLTEQGKYSEAVKQYLREGQEMEALDLALEHTGNVTLDANAFSPISRKLLWRYLSFGCHEWPEVSGVPTNKILALLGLIPRDGLNDRDKTVVSRTPFLCPGDLANLGGVARYFQAHFAGNEVDECPENPFKPCSSL